MFVLVVDAYPVNGKYCDRFMLDQYLMWFVLTMVHVLSLLCRLVDMLRVRLILSTIVGDVREVKMPFLNVALSYFCSSLGLFKLIR